MRTQRELYSENKIVYESEWDECPQCRQTMKPVYTSGWKTVQSMNEVVTIAQRPKHCVNAECDERNKLLRSVRWQQVAPMWCTYG
jgi:hypothetical protein